MYKPYLMEEETEAQGSEMTKETKISALVFHRHPLVNTGHKWSFGHKNHPELKCELQMPKHDFYPLRVSCDTEGSPTYFLSSCTELGCLISIKAQPNFWGPKEMSEM